MASRDRTSRWPNLRPWQILNPRGTHNTARGNSAVEIWSLLDEMIGGGPYRPPRYEEPGFSHFRFILDDNDDLWGHEGMMDTRLRDWVVSRSLEMDESRARPIDTSAVLAKCHTEIYKPKSRSWNGKSVVGQEDCPVCLEKFVADQVLYRIPCNHLFHKDCLTPWIQSNHGDCPCCRADILGSSASAPSGNNLPRAARPGGVTTNSGRGGGERPPLSPHSSHSTSHNGNLASNASSRSGRRESDDIMSVLSAMEAALDRLGFRTY